MSKPNQEELTGAKLKPVAEKRDSSAPALDPNAKSDLTKGKKNKDALKDEISKGKQLKPVKTRDASSPLAEGVVLNLPDKAKVEEIIKQLWSKDNRRAWILLTYSNADTVVYQAHGQGPVSEAVALLDDAKMQYFLVRIPVDAKSGEIEVKKVRDVFVAWTGPKVGVIEKGRKKIHIGKVAAFLKPSHAELQAVNRQLLTEENLLYCSDPHGAHIIDYDATADPRVRNALLGDISKGAQLKKGDTAHDASKPAIDPHLKVNVKENSSEQLAKEIETGKQLKHADTAHDASKPAIDPHLKVDVKGGKQRKEKLKAEIAEGAKLKHTETVHDSSAPAVPEPIKCPESAQVKELIGKLFNKTAQRGWVLLGYKDKSTIGLEGSGAGPVSEVVAKLADDKIQYFLVRIPIGDTQGEVHASTTRDVFVVWTGPKVGVIEKAKKKIDFGGVSVLLAPHAASLQAVQKELLSEDNLAYCSDPHAGTHIIDYQAINDPKVQKQLKSEIAQGAKLKPVEHTIIDDPPKK